MDLTRRKRKNETVVIGYESEPCHDLQLYLLHPESVVSLAEFEELALDRLKVLRIIEQTNIREGSKSFEERRALIIADIKKQGLKLYSKLLSSSGCSDVPSEADRKAQTDDRNAHFILRIAYCRSDALRKWLMAREVELFRLRFLSLSSRGVRNFLNAYCIKYSPITENEKNSLKELLATSTIHGSHAMVESTDFYKVLHTEVTDLVSSRKVFVSAGFAYVPGTELISVIITMFRKILSYNLSALANALPYLEEDQRIIDFLNGLHTMHTGETYNVVRESGCIKPEDVDGLSRVSFPLCMRQVHDSLRAQSVCKHGGRMQYGLFLKAIGLSMEDSLRFWKEAFSKKIDADTFDRRYAYNIRHNYGQEGKRTNYSPYSCIKIIQGPVGADDCHGCPFRHCSTANLTQRLVSFGVPTNGVEDIMNLVSQHHYQIACTKYFELVHNTPAPEVINHPNQYFEMSQEILTGKPASGRVKAEKPSSSTTRSSTSSSRGADGEGQTSTNSTSIKEEEEWDEMSADISAVMQNVEH